MRILALILLFVSLSVEAVAPVISCTATGANGTTSGTAPFAVYVDCTGTTDADTTKPFHDLFYVHTFGDPSSGLWTYGANTSLSKNFATGPIAGHIYETAGTYTITSTVSDGTNIARTTNTITVSDPDTTYSGTNTVCFFNSAVGTGCPSGATQTSSSDWDAAIASCMGTTKRCLFKRGDTFTASAATTVSAAGPNTIGAYGSGALPIVDLQATSPGIYINNVAVNDLRIMDIDFLGDAADAAGQTAIESSQAVSGVTILRVTARQTGGQAVVFPLKCTYCVIQDSTISGQYNGWLVNVIIFSGAILGNSFGPVGGGTGEGILRVQQAQKTVVANNTITTPAATKAAFTFRGVDHVTTAEDSFYNIVSDNKIIQGANAAVLFEFQSGGGTDIRIYDVIVERNWLVGSAFTGGGTCWFASITTVRGTIRNNLVDMSGPTCETRGIYVQRDPGVQMPTPDDNRVYNNTIYSSATNDAWGVIIGAHPTTTVVKNNLCWMDVSANGFCVGDFAVGSTVSNNSTDPQTTGTDPAFDTPLTSPIGFRIGTGSYAATGGTAIWPASNDDFFHCDDTTANEHMGAFVSRTRATCRGAAGP